MTRTRKTKTTTNSGVPVETAERGEILYCHHVEGIRWAEVFRGTFLETTEESGALSGALGGHPAPSVLPRPATGPLVGSPPGKGGALSRGGKSR
jgi:hypothetical protein